MAVGCPTSPSPDSPGFGLVNGMAGINSGISNALDWGWDMVKRRKVMMGLVCNESAPVGERSLMIQVVF